MHTIRLFCSEVRFCVKALFFCVQLEGRRESREGERQHLVKCMRVDLAASVCCCHGFMCVVGGVGGGGGGVGAVGTPRGRVKGDIKPVVGGVKRTGQEVCDTALSPSFLHHFM